MAKIVCLCGSTRFKEQYQSANKYLTHQGVVVVTVGCFPHPDGETLGVFQKTRLDVLHLAKIEISDEVWLVSDETGYIGESTLREALHALEKNKPVYLVTMRKDGTEPHSHRTQYGWQYHGTNPTKLSIFDLVGIWEHHHKA